MSALIIRATYRTRPKPLVGTTTINLRAVRIGPDARLRFGDASTILIANVFINLISGLHLLCTRMLQPLEIPKLSLILHYLDDSAGRIFFCISLLVSYYLNFSEIFCKKTLYYLRLQKERN